MFKNAGEQAGGGKKSTCKRKSCRMIFALQLWLGPWLCIFNLSEVFNQKKIWLIPKAQGLSLCRANRILRSLREEIAQREANTRREPYDQTSTSPHSDDQVRRPTGVRLAAAGALQAEEEKGCSRRERGRSETVTAAKERAVCVS